MVRACRSARMGATKRMAGWWARAKTNPTPSVSIASARRSGPTSRRTPSASSTSADPERLVTPRFPCLAMRTPAAAATKVAVVLTLIVETPVPPVPHVSSSGPSTRTGTFTARSRIAWAKPTISSTVSPRVRSAARSAAACICDSSPSIRRPITPRASSVREALAVEHAGEERSDGARRRRVGSCWVLLGGVGAVGASGRRMRSAAGAARRVDRRRRGRRPRRRRARAQTRRRERRERRRQQQPLGAQLQRVHPERPGGARVGGGEDGGVEAGVVRLHGIAGSGRDRADVVDPSVGRRARSRRRRPRARGRAACPRRRSGAASAGSRSATRSHRARSTTVFTPVTCAGPGRRAGSALRSRPSSATKRTEPTHARARRLAREVAGARRRRAERSRRRSATRSARAPRARPRGAPGRRAGARGSARTRTAKGHARAATRSPARRGRRCRTARPRAPGAPHRPQRVELAQSRPRVPIVAVMTLTRARAAVTVPCRRPRASARKFRSMSWPSSVSTLSGWNWTPQVGCSAWRRPMIVRCPASSTQAFDGSSGGGSSTTSEW